MCQHTPKGKKRNNELGMQDLTFIIQMPFICGNRLCDDSDDSNKYKCSFTAPV